MAKVPDNLPSYQKHFDNNAFWELLLNSAKSIGKVPVRNALILYYLYMEGLDSKEKLLVLGALGYLILPLDLIPDVIPIVGWTDDAAALAYVAKKIMDSVSSSAWAMATAKANQKLAEWF